MVAEAAEETIIYLPLSRHALAAEKNEYQTKYQGQTLG